MPLAPGRPSALACALLVLSSPAFSQNGAPSERAPLQVEIEQRVRNENWNNLFDLSDRADDQRNQVRYRTRFTLDAPLPASVDLGVALAQETNQKIGKENAFDEVFFETAYLDFRRVFSDRLSLRVGRQNFLKGDGFLLSEGGPQDGSRAAYFNGFDLAYGAKRSRFELIGIFDPKRDRFLPRFNDRHRLLVDWDEQAIGTYVTRILRTGSVEGYYFVKREFHDERAASNPLFQPDRRVNTAGARAVRRLGPALSLTGEFTFQHGVTQPGIPIRAWGGYGYAKRTFQTKRKPWVKAGYWGLSRDWDPLFSRGATYGDLNLYSEVYEKSIGYITNLHMAHVEAGFNPSQRLSCRFTWERMRAFHPATVNPRIFGTGLDRGTNLQARADFRLSGGVRGHVDFETLLPGDFYTDANRAYFLRFELIYSHKLPLRRALKRS